MRKQGILLLTFVSVIMMLSIYYITLPLETEMSEASTQFDSLQLAKENEDQEYLNNESKIVSSASSSLAEKQTALNNIERKKELMKIEDEIENTLKENNIYAMCTIKNEVVYIQVNDHEESKDKVLKILEIIMPKFSAGYLFEVSFLLK